MKNQNPPTKIKKKKSPLAEFCSWTFDLAFLGLLIWFFSSAQNQRMFWNFLNEGAGKGLAATVQGVSSLLGSKNDSDGNETHSAAKKKKTEPVTVENESSPPPPTFVPPPLPTEEQLASQVPGDCFPPELRSLSEADLPEPAKLFYQPAPLPKETKKRKGKGKPIKFEKKKVNGIPLYLCTIDLNDPDAFLVIRLPKDSQQANSSAFSAGHENFESFVKKYPAALLINGTFFSKDQEERVMGNMVSEGKLLKYSPWENYGTTFSLREADYPEMVTTRAEGKPNWDKHWFSLTCGPRLIKEGEIWLNPELEGFADPHVLGCGSRAAIGFNKNRDKIFIVTFLRGLYLKDEAKLMKAIGCFEAMNLDGGASKALSQNGKIVMKPGRGLTNVLVVYDSTHKAPKEVIASWQDFQNKSSDTAIGTPDADENRELRSSMISR